VIGWGVVATGGIANVVTSDMLLVDDTEVRAVASRDIGRAQEFAAKYGIAKPYGDYRELIADPGVDVVYIASPHSGHYDVAKEALLAGKAVLCEKPITVTLAAAEELVAVARDRGVFLMEAMWTRFNPLVRKLRGLVADGAIGEVRTVQADLGAVFPTDPMLGGGSLLDVGIYPVAFTQMLLGEPAEIVTHGLVRNEVDAHASLLLRYPDGVSALLFSSIVASCPSKATVVGTKGRIELGAPFFATREMVLTVEGSDPVVEKNDLWGNGYTYQIAEVNERVRNGDKESPEVTLDDTLAVARILSTALAQLGVSYPDTVR
jgi:predicted dehydrogenase